jgi:hypothetical protein
MSRVKIFLRPLLVFRQWRQERVENCQIFAWKDAEYLNYLCKVF